MMDQKLFFKTSPTFIQTITDFLLNHHQLFLETLPTLEQTISNFFNPLI